MFSGSTRKLIILLFFKQRFWSVLVASTKSPMARDIVNSDVSGNSAKNVTKLCKLQNILQYIMKYQTMLIKIAWKRREKGEELLRLACVVKIYAILLRQPRLTEWHWFQWRSFPDWRRNVNRYIDVVNLTIITDRQRRYLLVLLLTYS